MNLKELTWPVRVYWDLPSEDDGSGLHRKVSRELVELKILSVSLRDDSAGPGRIRAEVLEALRGKSMAVSLTLGRRTTDRSPDAGPAEQGVRTLLYEVESLAEAREVLAGNGSPAAGLSFAVDRNNFREIPGLLPLCREQGIRELVFPIQRLSATGDVFYLTAEERDGIGREMAGMDRRDIRLTIHDPFLWQVFFPGTDYHEGGCQAGNSMLYLSPDYAVLPCPAMPLPLGDLRRDSLREIVLSERKKDLRSSLGGVPEECAACAAAAACLGGCRGRAFAAQGSLLRRDPACGGVR